MRTPSTRRFADERGVALVEFALVLPILLLLLFGIVEFGKAFNYWIDETHLAASGARWAVVNKNPGPGATLQESIQRHASASELQAASVCIEFPNGTANVGDPVEVTVAYTYNWIPFVADEAGLAPITLRGSATMRLETRPTRYSAGSGGTGTCA